MPNYRFASDIFHDLHEQVMVTSARGRKLLNRVQHLETSLPSFENAIRGQRSHIHFAYVAGIPPIDALYIISTIMMRTPFFVEMKVSVMLYGRTAITFNLRKEKLGF